MTEEDKKILKDEDKKYIWSVGYKKNTGKYIPIDGDYLENVSKMLGFDPCYSVRITKENGEIVVPTEVLENIGEYIKPMHVSGNDIFIACSESFLGSCLYHFRYNDETKELNISRIRSFFNDYSIEEFQKDGKRVAIIKCKSEQDQNKKVAFLYSIDEIRQITQTFRDIELVDKENGIYRFTDQIRINQDEIAGIIGHLNIDGNIDQSIYDEYFNKERKLEEQNCTATGYRNFKEKVKNEALLAIENNKRKIERLKKRTIEEMK